MDIDSHNLYPILESQGNSTCVLAISHFNSVAVLSIVSCGWNFKGVIQPDFIGITFELFDF